MLKHSLTGGRSGHVILGRKIIAVIFYDWSLVSLKYRDCLWKRRTILSSDHFSISAPSVLCTGSKHEFPAVAESLPSIRRSKMQVQVPRKPAYAQHLLLNACILAFEWLVSRSELPVHAERLHTHTHLSHTSPSPHSQSIPSLDSSLSDPFAREAHILYLLYVQRKTPSFEEMRSTVMQSR